MRPIALLAMLWAGSPAIAAPPAKTVPAGALIQWTSDEDGEGAAYRAGPYRLRINSVDRREGEGRAKAPQVWIDGPRGMTQMTGVAGFQTWAFTSVVVGRFDPASPALSVLMSSYSGGAHCCTEVQAATPIAAGWKVSSFGSWDNEPLNAAPTDIDGDGALDLMIPDSRFSYAFGCYACVFQPTRIFNLRAGEPVDVSAEARFRSVFAKDIDELAAACRGKQGGACPAYVISAIRLGRFDEAWSTMRAAVDASFWYPQSYCATDDVDGKCPDGQERPLADYPTSLRHFLVAYGYLPK